VTSSETATADGRLEEDRAADEPGRDLLVLRIGGARFGVWIDEVLEIVQTPPISRLPLGREEVAGVTSVRGDVLPVLDLGVRLLDSPSQRPGRLILVRHYESDSLVAMLVDGVDTLMGVRDDDVDEAPAEALVDLPEDMVTGVVADEGGVITILHIGGVAAPPDGATEEE
jgi:purine-binding chemotaxis protein CheW